MIHRLERAMQEAFLTVGDISDQGVSAANEAMFLLLHSPVFNGAYKHHYLDTDARGRKKLMYHRYATTMPADPLREIMDEDGLLAGAAPDPGPGISTPDRLLAVAANADTLVGRILHADQTLRRAPTIDLLDDTGLRGLTSSIVGPWGDFSLSRFGIKYHKPSWTSYDMRYLVAHTPLEIAGVLGVNRGKDCAWGLIVPYVSVSPGFQRQGVATALYARCIELAKIESRYIIRSNTSHDTPTLATQRFDAMLNAAGIVHVISGTYLEGAVATAYASGFDGATHDKMLHASMVVAHARQTMGRSSKEFDEVDRAQALDLRSALLSMKDLPAPRAPRLR